MDLDSVIDSCDKCKESNNECIECGNNRCLSHLLMYEDKDDSACFGTCLICIYDDEEKQYRGALNFLDNHKKDPHCRNCRGSKNTCIECEKCFCGEHMYINDDPFGICLACISLNEDYYDDCIVFLDNFFSEMKIEK